MNATSRTSSSNSLTTHDEEKKDDNSTPEAIAKRLRDKIRLQAESLLTRCETADRSRQSSRNVSRQASRDSSPRGGCGSGSGGSGNNRNEAVESSSSLPSPTSDGSNSNVFTPRTYTADLWPDRDTSGTRENTPPTRSSSSSNSNNPDSLTKRLQQLALQRQSIDGNRDRLRVIQSDASSHLSSKCTSFADLPHLPPHLLQALYQMGFDRPSAIQEEALPRILAGRHVIGQAQSGSGKVRTTTPNNTGTCLYTRARPHRCWHPQNIERQCAESCCRAQASFSFYSLCVLVSQTAAFTIGMLYRMDPTLNATQALCVTPTRELAIQIVQKAVQPMAVNFEPPIRIQLAISQAELVSSAAAAPATTTSASKTTTMPSTSLSSLSSLRQQQQTVQQPHLVVGTPGKIVDWLKRKMIQPQSIKVFCLDEADTMVESGSGHRANSLLIKKQLPASTQCLFFSATFSPPVIQFASKLVPSADKILIEDGPEFLVRCLRVSTSRSPM
jgi:DEAD/DEAH box helicase